MKPIQVRVENPKDILVSFDAMLTNSMYNECSFPTIDHDDYFSDIRDRFDKDEFVKSFIRFADVYALHCGGRLYLPLPASVFIREYIDSLNTDDERMATYIIAHYEMDHTSHI